VALLRERAQEREVRARIDQGAEEEDTTPAPSVRVGRSSQAVGVLTTSTVLDGTVAATAPSSAGWGRSQRTTARTAVSASAPELDKAYRDFRAARPPADH